MRGRLGTRYGLLAVSALLVAVVGAACGDDDDTTNGAAATSTSPASATATIPPELTEPPVAKLRVALSQLPSILDPRLANPQTKIYLTLLFDHLVGANREGTDLSKDTGVAESWSTSDNIVWQFQLREGFKFSDGKSVTSADVKFSIERILAEGATSPNAPALRSLIASIDTPSDRVVEFKLKLADFSFPYYLSPLQGTEGMVVPKDHVSAVGNEAFAKKPIGSGPYVLVDVNPGVSISFDWRKEKHPIYQIPRYGQISYTSVPEQSTRLAMLSTGQADLVDMDLATANPADLERSGFVVFEKAGVNVVGVQLHGQGFDKDALTSNEKFRQALALAINKKEIQTAIYRGRGQLNGVAFAGSQAIGYESLAPYPFDPAKAKALLSEIGYDGRTVDMYAFDIAGIPGLRATAEAIAGYWQDVGVKVKLQSIEYGSFRPLWFDKKIPGAASVIGIANRPFPHSGIYATQFGCKGSISYSCDPGLDSIVAEMLKTTSDKEAYASYVRKVNKYIYDHYMSIPIIEIGTFYAGNNIVPKQWSLGLGQYDINAPALISFK